MSGVLGAFTVDAPPLGEGSLQRMLGGMRARGSECSAVWTRDGAALAVARNAWEQAPEFSGDALVLWDRDVTIAADASLYYRRDLERQLTAVGARVRGTTPSHLILAAYRAWSDECVRHLEGDYAFILWDHSRRRVFAARDFAGSRPLFYAELGRTLVVASTLAAVRAHPDCRDELNHAVLAETAANLWQSPHETAYTAVTAIPAGFSLSWTGPGTAGLAQHWAPPAISSRNAAPMAEAAAELRDRVARAVDERLAPRQVTSVWMSGGRDSTAVFGGGQYVLGQRPGERQLRPVSVSYPPGDKGREDEAIASVAQYWNAPVHWLDSSRIPLCHRSEHGAAARDEPYEPLYETFIRALAGGSRAVNARVALDGWGGDQLFGMSPIYLADLFRTGRWLALAREWRALRLHDLRLFFRMAITPALPPFLRIAAGVLRGGRALSRESDTRIPDWVRPGWAKTLTERQHLHMPPRRRGSFANHELYTCLTRATASRARGWLSALALDEGVEVRSPLYDARIIELAVRRPVPERRSGRDTKVLLRAAMRGLLPEPVLAPRSNRTGVMDDYLKGAMRATYTQLLNEVLDAPVVLADLGIIEPSALRRAAAACLSECWDEQTAVALLFTLHTEMWLRAHVEHGARRVEHTDTHDDGPAWAVLSPARGPA